MHFADTPILADMILELSEARTDAERDAAAAAVVLADLEALHEPDGYGECPTCRAAAPCATLRLLRRELTLDQAFADVRDHQPVDLTAAEPPPPVPSLAQLLATSSPAVDRVFDALLGRPPAGPGH